MRDALGQGKEKTGLCEKTMALQLCKDMRVNEARRNKYVIVVKDT